MQIKRKGKVIKTMTNKTTLTDRINAIAFDTLTEDEFNFLVERAQKSIRKSTKPAVRKPSKAHEANVALIPQVEAVINEKGQVTAEDLEFPRSA